MIHGDYSPHTGLGAINMGPPNDNGAEMDGKEVAESMYSEEAPAVQNQQPQQVKEIFTGSPAERMEQMKEVVEAVASECTGEKYIAKIQGKNYPTVAWWSTVGGVLGLFPVTKWVRKLDREGEIAYEARVEVRHNGHVVTAGEAMCSSEEKTWSNRDEYAIKSMAQTRATGRAYRMGLPMLAKMAGLEDTPAEEMPRDSKGGGSPVSRTIDRFKALHGTKGGDGETPPWNVISDYVKKVSGGDKYKLTQCTDDELDEINELLDQKDQAKKNGNDPDEIAEQAANGEGDDGLPFNYETKQPA